MQNRFSLLLLIAACLSSAPMGGYAQDNNTTPGRDKFHPKGRDNGYILTVGDTRIYIAGDTENIPEMKQIKNIDIAFLPVNQPYTMIPEQAIQSAKIIQPHILYPYHYGDTNINEVKDGLKNEKEIEVRIRALQ